jgi:D-alanyl-D-alanine dipeptidase
MFLHKKMVASLLSVLLGVALHFSPSCFGQTAHSVKSNSGGHSRLNDSIALVNPYGLMTVTSLKEYQQHVISDPDQELVALAGFIPGVVLDIRYATSDNLMHHPVYTLPVAFLRRPAAEALRSVAEELRPLGYGLKVFDGYRPYKVTVQFYEAYHDSNFVASPYTGSRHNRGCAVDLTLVDLATGKEPEMPTGYDAFTKEAAADYAGASPAALQNRKVLQDAMLRHGFLLYPSEWWHFDFSGWKNYPVTDIPFEELTGKK